MVICLFVHGLFATLLYLLIFGLNNGPYCCQDPSLIVKLARFVRCSQRHFKFHCVLRLDHADCQYLKCLFYVVQYEADYHLICCYFMAKCSSLASCSFVRVTIWLFNCYSVVKPRFYIFHAAVASVTTVAVVMTTVASLGLLQQLI